MLRLIKLPDGLLTDQDRTFWLMPPFSLKIEGRVIARGIISIIARISGINSTDPHIDGKVATE